MQRILHIIIGIAFLIFFKLFYAYFGLGTILIPAIGIAVIWFLGNKYRDISKKPMLPAIAIEGGHLVWIITGFFVIAALNPQNITKQYQFNILESLFDVIVFGALLMWLWRKPAKISGIFNIVFQFLAIIGAIYSVYELNFNLDTLLPRALIIHIILRVSAIIALLIGIYKLKKESTSAQTELSTFQTPK